MKVIVGVFNQERALVGAISVIVKTDCIGVPRGAGGPWPPPGKNILLGRTELGSLAERKLTV